MRRFFYVVLCSIFLISCFKDSDIFIPRENTPNGDIKNIFDELKSIPEQFAIDQNQEYIRIRNNQGTIFTLNRSDMIHSDGSSPNGDLLFEILEIHSKGEMILNEVPTISDKKKIISSDGVFNITASDKIGNLDLSSNSMLKIQHPFSTNYDKQMQLFYGGNNPTSSQFQWIEGGNDNPISRSEWQDSLANDQFNIGYECLSENFDWINIDKYIDEYQTAEICVELTSEFSEINSAVFMVLKDWNSVVNFVWKDGKFCLDSAPIGFDVTLVVLAEQDDKYFYGTGDSNISENLKVTIELVERSLAEIKELMKEL